MFLQKKRGRSEVFYDNKTYGILKGYRKKGGKKICKCE